MTWRIICDTLGGRCGDKSAHDLTICVVVLLCKLWYRRNRWQDELSATEMLTGPRYLHVAELKAFIFVPRSKHCLRQ